MIEQIYYLPILAKLTLLAFVVAFLGYIVALVFSKRLVDKSLLMFFLTTFLLILAFIIDTWLIVDRWITTGREPFKTWYEATIFITWATALIYIIAELIFKVRLLGVFVSLGILLTFLFAVSKRDVEALPLMAALQSPLFIPHVLSYVMGYGAFFIAFLSAILYLIFPRDVSWYWLMSGQKSVNFSSYAFSVSKFGFLFLTLGLLIGSWWGQEAWSNYWGWDSKENWALVSWFAFVGYFHLKYIWDDKKLAIVIIIGFLAILFTYLGMQYLPGPSLHKYTS